MSSYRSLSSLFLFCLFICKSYGQFRKTPLDSYQVSQGRSLELPCVTDQRNVMCTWLKNGNVVANRGRYKYTTDSLTGDCSIHIHNITYPEDDVIWQCQVPSLSDTSGWPRTKITVLIEPQAPTLSFKNNFAEKIVAERLTNISCHSFGGNPFPRFEWYLNGQNITSNANTQISDDEAVSSLAYTFTKTDKDASLSCKTVHPLKSQIVSKTLDVQYKPVVSVSQKVFTVDDGSTLEVNCDVDANPNSVPYWKPNKDIPENRYVIRGSKLTINVDHEMDGVEFQCSTQNNIGSSQPEAVQLNVLYTPRLVKTFPKNTEDIQKIQVGSDLRLECYFIGNPKPEVRWIFMDSLSQKDHTPQSNDGTLLLKNISYMHEGTYFCEGRSFNPIKNVEDVTRTANPFVVDVVGKPLFMIEHETVFGYDGLNTRLQQVFCSDPFPKKIQWQIDQDFLDVDLSLENKPDSNDDEILDGSHIKVGRLTPLQTSNSRSMPTCFTASLTVANTDHNDRRDYVIIVDNSYGTSRGIVTLEIHSFFSGALLISIAMIVLILIVVFTILALLFMRRRSLLSEEVHSSPEKIEKGGKLSGIEMNN